MYDDEMKALMKCRDIDSEMLKELLSKGFTPLELIETSLKQALPRIYHYKETRVILLAGFEELQRQEKRITKSNLTKAIILLGLRNTVNHSTLVAFMRAYEYEIRLYHQKLSKD